MTYAVRPEPFDCVQDMLVEGLHSSLPRAPWIERKDGPSTGSGLTDL